MKLKFGQNFPMSWEKGDRLMKKGWVVFLFILLAPALGLARSERVRAGEGDISVPYTSLGTLEVKKKVSGFSDLGWKTWQVLTEGGAKSSAQAEHYRKALKCMLVRRAAKQYGANAVIHVQYWPDPASEGFPKGWIYARGEMVRYKPFPASKT